MEKPSRKSKAKSVSPESEGQQSQPPAIEAMGFTSGLVSLLVPVVLPLAVLAVVLMASLTLAQASADSETGGRINLEVASTMESRSIR